MHPSRVQQVLGGSCVFLAFRLPQETSSAPVRGSGWPGSVNQDDEDMSELVPVCWHELDLKDPHWQTKEGKHEKEMESLVKDTKTLGSSLTHVSCAPADRILQPRQVLTLRTKDDGTLEVKCRCTLQGFKDSDVLDLVRDRKTESATLSANVER